MPQTTSTYAFIGLGQMGHGMAKSLRQKLPSDSILLVYDVNKVVLQDFVDAYGVHGNVCAVSSPRQIAERADVVMTSVPQARHVEDAFLNPETGLLSVPSRTWQKTLFLELSTIDALVSSRIAEAVATGGYGNFVDAPCSGGQMGAEKGTLSFMIGCPDHLFPAVHEICLLMGSPKGIFHCGGLGSGLKTKLLNNYLSSLTALATAETINIGMMAGRDPFKLNDVLNASSGMSFNSAVNNPVPGLTPNNAASKGYVGGFSIELCLGVLELGVKAARDLQAKTTLGEPMLAAYKAAAAEEQYKGKDSKVIYKWLGGEDPKSSAVEL